ncbi:unnamed protein product [Strongylus vulgaris]|uniref:Ubiquinol-cytochrome c chaperone domain-containing protein n=1 Tax=Strongylus vulgaris TaxID=40348 RepID=A0A3P7I1C5_STRVU|nr:unnamed protein product [Strongylus vulgaris]
MLARTVVRRFINIRSIASTSKDPSSAHKVTSVDDLAQNLLSAPPSRLPKAFVRLRAAWRNRMYRDSLDPTLKNVVASSSSSSAEHFLLFSVARYCFCSALLQLCEQLRLREALRSCCVEMGKYWKVTFGLPDYMSSWYKLTLMHCWMVLTRMHVSLDAQAYLRLQRSMLATLWLDVDTRLKIVSEELKQTLTSESDMKKMHGLHLQTFLEYDEGFLADDRVFAGAIWRCLYLSRTCDPIHVLRVIAYMRSTIAWLDTLDLNDILIEGVKEWKQLKPKDATYERKADLSAEVSEEKKKYETKAL